MLIKVCWDQNRSRMQYSFLVKISEKLQENHPHAFGADHGNDANILKGNGQVDLLEKFTINIKYILVQSLRKVQFSPAEKERLNQGPINDSFYEEYDHPYGIYF